MSVVLSVLRLWVLALGVILRGGTVVAVVERGGVLLFCNFFFFWLTIKVNFDCKKLFIAKEVVRL